MLVFEFRGVVKSKFSRELLCLKSNLVPHFECEMIHQICMRKKSLMFYVKMLTKYPYRIQNSWSKSKDGSFYSKSDEENFYF